MVSIGCGDDTADRAVQEIRNLVEQDGANVVIGPLSGDEGHRHRQLRARSSGGHLHRRDLRRTGATLQVQAPNFFRYNGDGAQWNAGLGDILHNDAGWDTAVVIADDYGFGWTSAAGFIAEFCAVGGDVVSQVFPPLGTTDYSSFVQQLPNPDEVDGYFWVVGGTGTKASLEAFVNAKGDLNGRSMPATCSSARPSPRRWGPTSPAPTSVASPRCRETSRHRRSRSTSPVPMRPGTPSPVVTSGNEPAPPSTSAGLRLRLRLLRRRHGAHPGAHRGRGRPLRQPAALREAASTIDLDVPYGPVTLDENRQAIIDTFVAAGPRRGDGQVVQQTVSIIRVSTRPSVARTRAETAPPERDNTPAKRGAAVAGQR